MSERRTVLLRVAYDGAAYSGWAKQNNAPTVEATLVLALAKLDPAIVAVRGMSRTDAGVHARSQYVAFESARSIDPRGWVLGTNRFLPEDVAVRAAAFASEGFDPRFACERKRYGYALSLDPVRDPLRDARAWRLDRASVTRFDESRARIACRALEGTHDFGAFRSAEDKRENTTRTLYSVSIGRDAEDESRRVNVRVEGTGFLHNMVRILVGTLVDIASGRKAAECIEEAFRTRDRRVLGPTAPAHALTLEHATLAVDLSEPFWPSAI